MGTSLIDDDPMRCGLRRFRVFGLALLCCAVAACAAPPVARGIHDPYEAQNRKRFERSVAADQAVLRPIAKTYGQVVPEPARIVIGNVGDNLSLPSSVVNNVLQANFGDAIVNGFRFVFNSTVGLAGMFDPASLVGVTARTTDFGETLHVWGVAEGAYLVLPMVGPSTERDAVGKVIDLFTNPLSYVLAEPEIYALPVTGLLGRVGDRYQFGSTVDSLLYDSADPYSQTRLLYLENRRFQLGGQTEDDYFDPYEDIYLD